MFKYMFNVIYKDGSYYEQNYDDVSVIKGEGSSFSDVDIENVARFNLCGEGHIYTVDLTDGHFEVDGLKFKLHEEPLSDFRLIFFRRHTHHFNVEYEELSHDIVFRFGWQANMPSGENVQRVIEIE